MTPADVEALSPSERLALLRTGRPFTPALLVGDWRGVSLGLPAWVDRVAWKLFRKSFRPDGDSVSGFNVRVEQRPGPTRPLERGGVPITFGPFRVRPARETPFGTGVVLDYGATHPRWHPLARTRDVLVEIGPDLLLGALYVEVLGAGLRTPSVFTLERERQDVHVQRSTNPLPHPRRSP